MSSEAPGSAPADVRDPLRSLPSGSRPRLVLGASQVPAGGRQLHPVPTPRPRPSAPRRTPPLPCRPVRGRGERHPPQQPRARESGTSARRRDRCSGEPQRPREARENRVRSIPVAEQRQPFGTLLGVNPEIFSQESRRGAPPRGSRVGWVSVWPCRGSPQRPSRRPRGRGSAQEPSSCQEAPARPSAGSGESVPMRGWRSGRETRPATAQRTTTAARGDGTPRPDGRTRSRVRGRHRARASHEPSCLGSSRLRLP